MSADNKKKLSQISTKSFSIHKKHQLQQKMSEDLVATMTKSDLCELFNNLIDIKIKNIATKSDLEVIANVNKQLMEKNLELATKVCSLEKNTKCWSTKWKNCKKETLKIIS